MKTKPRGGRAGQTYPLHRTVGGRAGGHTHWEDGEGRVVMRKDPYPMGGGGGVGRKELDHICQMNFLSDSKMKTQALKCTDKVLSSSFWIK